MIPSKTEGINYYNSLIVNCVRCSERKDCRTEAAEEMGDQRG